MLWFHCPAYFFAGAIFANVVPHFVSGVLGRTFPTPFASPPFRGASSPRTNVLYGLANLALIAGAPEARRPEPVDARACRSGGRT